MTPRQGDIVRHKNGGAPWLVLEVGTTRANEGKFVIARRESFGVVEGVRPFADYEIIERPELGKDTS